MNVNLYCVYDHPKDYPDDYVLRRFVVKPDLLDPVPDEEPILVVRLLTTIQEWAMVRGLHFIPRSPQDDACIIGTYV